MHLLHTPLGEMAWKVRAKCQGKQNCVNSELSCGKQYFTVFFICSRLQHAWNRVFGVFVCLIFILRSHFFEFLSKLFLIRFVLAPKSPDFARY